MRRMVLMALLAGPVVGCSYEPYRGDPDTVIARPYDTGSDDGALKEGGFAIVYDPDGCQNWIQDDGVEGYSVPRVNPDTGKQICDGKYPPGTVLGKYTSDDSGIRDFVPKPRRNR